MFRPLRFPYKYGWLPLSNMVLEGQHSWRVDQWASCMHGWWMRPSPTIHAPAGRRRGHRSRRSDKALHTPVIAGRGKKRPPELSFWQCATYSGLRAQPCHLSSSLSCIVGSTILNNNTPTLLNFFFFYFLIIIRGDWSSTTWSHIYSRISARAVETFDSPTLSRNLFG